MSAETVSITLSQQSDYQFLVDFGPGIRTIVSDEPAPLGLNEGPAPSHMLVAAAANCLAASLLFSLRKFKQTPEPITAIATGHMGRSPDGRLRMLSIDVGLTLGCPAEEMEHLQRVLDTFEQFCTVSQSIQSGVKVNVSVQDTEGKMLKATEV